MLRGFSWKHGISYFAALEDALVITPQNNVLPDLPKNTPYTLKPLTTNRMANLAFSVTPSQHSPSTGILTCFPSTTRFSLALGADSPCSD